MSAEKTRVSLNGCVLMAMGSRGKTLALLPISQSLFTTACLFSGRCGHLVVLSDVSVAAA